MTVVSALALRGAITHLVRGSAHGRIAYGRVGFIFLARPYTSILASFSLHPWCSARRETAERCEECHVVEREAREAAEQGRAEGLTLGDGARGELEARRPRDAGGIAPMCVRCVVSSNTDCFRKPKRW